MKAWRRTKMKDKLSSPLPEGLEAVNASDAGVSAFAMPWVAGQADDGTYCVALRGAEHNGGALIIARVPHKAIADYFVLLQALALETMNGNKADVAIKPMVHGEASLQAPWPHNERDRDM